VVHPYIDANELQQFFSKCFSVLLWIEGVIYKLLRIVSSTGMFQESNLAVWPGNLYVYIQYGSNKIQNVPKV